MGNPTNIAGYAAQQAILEDTELAASARALAQLAIKTATEYLTDGSPQMRMQVIKAIMPAIGRGLSEKSEDDTITELRKKLTELHQAVLGSSVA